MKKHTILLFAFILFTVTAYSQNKTLLFVEDFEDATVPPLFNLNTMGGSGNNLWIINKEFSGNSVYVDTPPQDSTLGEVGLIGTPNNKYMHIQNSQSTVLNANYNPASSSVRWAETKSGYCTFGYTKILLTFWWCAKGSPADYGEVYYSVDGGTTWKICTNTDGVTKYGNMQKWKYTVIEMTEFLDEGDLRFAFKWLNDGVNTNDELPFAVDDVMLVAEYNDLAAVEISALDWIPNPICHEEIKDMLIQFRVEEELCEGSYAIELSDSSGDFTNSTIIQYLNLPYTPGTFNTSWQIPLSTDFPIGSCYKFRINRTSPPYIEGKIYDGCIAIIECPDSIITKQPVVTMDASGYVCNYSVIDVPFNSYGAYNPDNQYYLELSDSVGSFDNPLQIGGPMDNYTTYDPALPTPPGRTGSVGGKIVPPVPPGCNYFLRVNSTSPPVKGERWGPFCIQECDIKTNETNDITVCITDFDSACVDVKIDINTFDPAIFYNNPNKFTFELCDAMTMAVIFREEYGSVFDTQSSSFTLCVPDLKGYIDDGLKQGTMYYMRIYSDNSSETYNQLGSLIHFKANGVSTEPLTVSINPDEVVCGSNGIITFTAQTISPTMANSQFLWTFAGYPYQTTETSVSLYASFFPSGIHEVTVQEVSPSPDCVAPVSPPANFKIEGAPDLSIVGDLYVCIGDTVTYTSVFTAATYYAWDVNDPGGNSTLVDSSNTGITVVWNSFGTAQLTLSALGKCGEGERSENVTIVPEAVIKLTSDTIICEDSYVDIIAINSAFPVDNNFIWTISGDTVREEYKQIGARDSLLNYFPSKTTDVAVMVDNGCPAKDTVTITVWEKPEIQVSDDKACIGDSVQLNAYSEGAASYGWSPGNYLSDPDIPDPVATPPNSIDYIVTITYDSICPPRQDTATITINSPAVDAGEDKKIFLGEQTQLNASGAAVYSWTPALGLSDTSVSNPIANPDTTTTYILLAKDGFGCDIKDTIIVFVIPFVFKPSVPDAFTPDDNDLNDRFFVYDIEGIDGQALESFDLKIFNRWGEIVYESEDIMEGWDGNHYKTGKEMEIGVYVWLLNCKTIKGVKFGPVSGNVSLIR